jgi:hypothetical protein
MKMRTIKRPRRYITRYWLALLTPAFRYSRSRDAFVLRVVGNSIGPVLRPDRRRAQLPFMGQERRGEHTAQRQARVA